nr:hypothetical protein GCM10020093_093890 [Planobispora longispora]
MRPALDRLAALTVGVARDAHGASARSAHGEPTWGAHGASARVPHGEGSGGVPGVPGVETASEVGAVPDGESGSDVEAVAGTGAPAGRESAAAAPGG